MPATLTITDLRKSYGDRPALAGASLAIDAGEICALLGPNGAGKSTMVTIVAGLMRPDSGAVVVNGVDVVAQPASARRHIGLASQDLAIYPSVTVRDNLKLFGQLAGLRRKALADRIDDAADRMALTELIDRPARRLSGGEKRRLHTAIALLARPALLLLDEPTAGVDVATRARMVAAINELAAQEGCAVCYSTHYLGEVEDLRASVAVLDHGRIIARGSIEELVRKHARSAVELMFDGPPPALDAPVDPVTGAPLDMEVDGNTVRIYCDEPAAVAGHVLAGQQVTRGGLRGVEFMTPSLEAVFLTLTGRRFSSDGARPGAGAADAEPTVEAGAR
ncbi:ABC transporter ATP-binding protein [Dactylosporangium sp. NPDC051541]|uniref:ABC transporter ATP-binding protein n=1 Tax=Dactylosporangium sp. NPDC051541 TaxID=3363977 RepID=UPI003798FDB4